MNTGQMLLTLCSMFILGLLILRVNSTFLATNDIMLNSKFGVVAQSLGTSVIEEASNKCFDQQSDTVGLSSKVSLTDYTKLGRDGTEVYPNFNDFDDFNNYTRVDSTIIRGVKFNITARVCYVTISGSNIIETNDKSWHKKIEVTVSSPSWKKNDGSLETIKLSSIFSYWYAR